MDLFTLSDASNRNSLSNVNNDVYRSNRTTTRSKKKINVETSDYRPSDFKKNWRDTDLKTSESNESDINSGYASDKKSKKMNVRER